MISFFCRYLPLRFGCFDALGFPLLPIRCQCYTIAFTPSDQSCCFQGNLLRGIDNKTVRKLGILVCSLLSKTDNKMVQN